MLSVKEQVTQTIETLSDSELQLVADYLDFLKFRARRQVISPLDETQLAELYQEAADEDRLLANEGMGEYLEGLRREDEE